MTQINAHTRQMIIEAIDEHPKLLKRAYLTGKSYSTLSDAVFIQDKLNSYEILLPLYFRAERLFARLHDCKHPDSDCGGVADDCQLQLQIRMDKFINVYLKPYPELDWFEAADVYQIAAEIGKLPAKQLPLLTETRLETT